MSEVRPASGHLLRSRRRAVRSGMSVCLALAVIYSFGYPGSAPLTSGAGATGKVLAQGSASLTDAVVPATGFVGDQQLDVPEKTSTFGTTDSLVPGQVIPGQVVPGTEESSRARATAAKEAAESLSTMERPGKGMLIAPLQFLAPSSPFGIRTSPITGEHGEFHSGQDFAAPCGTRVFSADAGIVRAVGWHPWGGGNRVEVDHGNGLVTTYNHLEGVAVKTGDRVGAGQVIATVGTTGWSTGCHLHFETILNGAHTDPEAWKLIPVDGSGPVEMPSLVNFTPGTGNGKDGETAWVAYLASSEPIHPVAFKSPSRVDAEVAALGKRSTTGKASPSTGKSTSGKPSSSTSLASSTPSSSGKPSTTTPSPKQSTAGTSTKPSKPGTSTPAPPSTGTTPPPSTSTDSTPTPPVTTPPATSTTPPSTSTDSTPTPPTTGTTPPPSTTTNPTPTPPATTPPVDVTPPATTPPSTTTDPTPPATTPPVDVTPPATTPPVTVPEPTPTVTDTVTAPATVCETVPDPATPENPAATVTVVVERVTGEPVLDSVTSAPISCELPTGSNASAATGTEPARGPGAAVVTAP